MLSILFLYFIGKFFFDLAKNNGKNKWLFAVLGIVSYYAGTAIAGVIFGLLAAFEVTEFFVNSSDIALAVMVLPIGLLTSWIFYKILESNWSKQPKENKNESLDSDMMQPPQSPQQ